jgi:hypothetical protein
VLVRDLNDELGDLLALGAQRSEVAGDAADGDPDRGLGQPVEDGTTPIGCA